MNLPPPNSAPPSRYQDPRTFSKLRIVVGFGILAVILALIVVARFSYQPIVDDAARGITRTEVEAPTARMARAIEVMLASSISSVGQDPNQRSLSEEQRQELLEYALGEEFEVSINKFPQEFDLTLYYDSDISIKYTYLLESAGLSAVKITASLAPGEKGHDLGYKCSRTIRVIESGPELSETVCSN